MVGAQLVAGIAQAGVGAPGVAALVAADAGRLALVLVGAGALVIAQPHALRAGASRLAVGHLAPVLTAAVVELAGVRRLAAPPVAAQAVPAGQGGHLTQGTQGGILLVCCSRWAMHREAHMPKWPFVLGYVWQND